MGKKCLIWYLAAAMFIIGIAPRLEAAFSPSEALLLSPAMREADVAKIQSILENKLVSQRLSDLGYSAQEIRDRLSQLSNEQLHSIAQRIDDLRVGQDAAGIVIFLLVALIVVLIVLLVTGRKVVVTK